MNAAVIPARGGSKRIARKNVREFAGKPMIAYSIECALRSGLFDRVLVSTDDTEIANVALAYGAEIPFTRPAGLSDDHTGTTAVVRHATAWLQSAGVDPAAVCCIYATAPFVRESDLARGFELLERGDWHYVFAATTFRYPIFRSFKTSPNGGVEMFFPEHFETRSQDLPEALHDAGQFYWGRPQAWLDSVRIFDTTSTVVMIPSWRAQDIDTPDDWERAQVVMSLIKQQGEDAQVL